MIRLEYHGEILRIIAIGFTGACAQVSILASPAVVGWASDQLAIAPAVAAQLVTAEFAGLAVTALFLAWRHISLKIRRAAVIGALLAVIGNLLTPMLTDLPILMAARCCTGIGLGLIGYVAMMSYSAIRRPIHAVTAVTIMVTLQGVALFTFSEMLRPTWGEGALFRLLAMSAGLAAIMSFFLTAGSSHLHMSLPKRWPLNSILMLACYALFILSNGTVWTFVERMAVGNGIDQASIAGALSIATAAVLVGVVLSNLKRDRHDLPALFLAVAIVAVTYAAIHQARTPYGFAAAVSVYTIGAAVANMGFHDIIAKIDRSGRLGGLSSGMGALATALGPAIGGLVVTHYGMIGVVVTGIGQIAFLLMCLGIVGLSHRRTGWLNPSGT